MGKGGYLGGSTIIRAWGGQPSRAKTRAAPIDLNAHLKKPKKQINKKPKRQKLTAAQKEAERKAREAAKKAQPNVVVEVRGANPQNAGREAARRSLKGNGLTIPDQVAKASKTVRTIEADIAKTKLRLVNLERLLVEARKQLERAENSPRRTALGQALADARHKRRSE
ncbi:hypothetical protein LZ016_07285 [Sphingomonas sp. SM33]|uniref:Uncharacterized protein n=1 Tax=Sphingomonas telluris TaxID=2907998 RepID=A0ABS9VLQ3_9SPHN|nr:hypothetical protein [Sphingomonas telluris]MCH8615901.1 hypothetical protein [Sphingomonas telluris]